MLPMEISYLAQERCKELRGETKEPTFNFVEFDFRKSLARLLHSLGNILEPKITRVTSVKQKA